MVNSATEMLSQHLYLDTVSCYSSWNDDAYEFALENQAGQGMRFEDPQDRKALVMGLALHEQGKQSLEKVQVVAMPKRMLTPYCTWYLLCSSGSTHWSLSTEGTRKQNTSAYVDANITLYSSNMWHCTCVPFCWACPSSGI